MPPSNEKLIAVQAEADNAVADAQAERDETLQEVARLESATASLGDQVLSADKQKEAAQTAHSQLKEQLQTETIRLHEKLAGSQAEVGRLRDDVVRVGQEKDRQADEASRLRGLNEELKRELAQARQQADTERQKATESTLEAGSLRNQLDQASVTQERLQDALEQQQAEALTLKTTVATQKARLEDHTSRADQLEAELVTLRDVRQEEIRQIANLTAERESAKARIRELVQECGELRQENKSILLVNARQQGKLG